MPDETKKKKSAPKRRRIEHWQIIAILLMIYDVVACNAAYFAALLVRFDFHYSEIPEYYLDDFYRFVPVYSLIVIGVFWAFRLYRSLWRFAGYTELIRSVSAVFVTAVLHALLITLIFRRMPYSYYFGGAIAEGILVVACRFSYRIYLAWRDKTRSRSDESKFRVMIIGAGEAGRAIYRELETIKESDMRVVCFIDDNPNKWGRDVDGVPVVGSRDDILASVQKYHIDRIFIAIPRADLNTRRNLVNLCSETNCEVKILPGTLQLVNGEATLAQMKDVAVEDLLGREVINVNNEEIYKNITNQVILVTGGGGSIGSELCRQIASHKPKQLIIFDIYENNAYDIQQELRKRYPEMDLQVLIGSIRDSRRLDSLFRAFHPDIVFHAAAHKHVPLMEDSPCEAIKNNVMGTYKTALAALRYGTRRFVLISTDKAINPTSIMGASKRLCEMVIQTMNEYVKSGKVSELPILYTHEEAQDRSEAPIEKAVTEFVAVRFGNVLGSNGSVIPLFKKQIEQGGPVTVTHPDIIRYFMTIPEAVSLVLQAASYAKGGEIFVLDMGEPVKIDTLARNLIKLSGFKPDEDIKIEYIGLRPGEKLYEEKLMDEEGLTTTANKQIFIGHPIRFDRDLFLGQLSELLKYAYENDEIVRDLTMKIVAEGRTENS